MRHRHPHLLAILTSMVVLIACTGETSAPVTDTADDSPPVTWAEPVEVAAGDAHRGPWRMNDSEFHFVDDPTVAIDNDGGVAVAWANQREQDIYFQRYSPAGEPVLAEPVNISRSGGIAPPRRCAHEDSSGGHSGAVPSHTRV